MSRASALRELSRWDIRVHHPFQDTHGTDWKRAVADLAASPQKKRVR